MQLNSEVVNQIFALVVTVLTVIVGYAAKKFNDKTNNEYARGVMQRLGEAIDVGVRYVQTELADDWKAASEDGVITFEEAKKLRDAAWNAAKLHLSEKGLAEVERIVAPDELMELVRIMIEAKLHQIKGSSK